MKVVSKKLLLSIAENFVVNIKEKDGELDVILGHNEHILSNYKRDNVKLVGGWYQNNIDLNTDFLTAIIEKYKINKLNFIGASKSCSGSIVLAKEIIRRRIQTPKMNLFLFSAYTTINKDIYIKRKLLERVPDSLFKLWDSEAYNLELIKKMELRRLIHYEDLEIFLFYPTRSKYGEEILAKRIEGANVHHIGLPVYVHNTLYPIWKKVNENRTIEIYENTIKKMHKDDYQFYLEMQEYEDYNFHLYSLLEDPEKFENNLNMFIENYMEKHHIV